MSITSAKVLSLVPFLVVFANVAYGQQLPIVDTRSGNFEDMLGFEVETGSVLPAPWISEGDVGFDHEIYRTGIASAKIAAGDSLVGLAFFSQFDFTGTNIEVRGFSRAENYSSGSADPISADWAEFDVSVPINPDVHTLQVGIVIPPGTGTIWLDDLEIFVDGQPLRDAPRLDSALADQEIAALRARAESAGPPAVAGNATIKTVHSAEIKILREGSNGWTCWAETLFFGPMCNQPTWDAWLFANWTRDESFEVERISLSYMLAGDGTPPHLMILAPDLSQLDGNTFIWDRGTPFAHVTLPFGGDAVEESLSGTFGPSRTQQILLSPLEIIPSAAE